MMLDLAKNIDMKTKGNKDNLEKVQDYLIDELGHYVDSLGGRVLLGRIWGLLLTSPEPVSLKEISAKLNVSKPAVSSTVNIGLQYGVFTKYYHNEYPRENFVRLKYDSLEMLVNPGRKKLENLYDKFKKGVELIDNMDIDNKEKEDLESIHVRMKYITECFKIFLDEYEKMSEIVIKKFKVLDKKYNTGGLK
jgi:DNA-binding transcriptional regulator GbsR (MarR family)